MAYCTHCGEELSQDDEYCPACGETIDHRTEEKHERHGLSWLDDITVPRPVLYAAVAGLVVGGGLYLLAPTAVVLIIGVGIAGLSIGVLYLDYRSIRSPELMAQVVAWGGGLYLVLLVVSALLTLRVEMAMAIGLEGPAWLLRGRIGIPLMVYAVVLGAVAVWQYRTR